MLVLVKKPRIELSLHGERVDELLTWIEQKYDVDVLSKDPDDELVPIESTAYWARMEENRVGNLLAAARLKAGLTQAQLAQKTGVRQNMISDYERGRRNCSPAMIKRLCRALNLKEELLLRGAEG